MKIKSFITAVVLLGTQSSIVLAGPIFDVNRTIGCDGYQSYGCGSVTGTIETDGTVGVLGSSNIVDWNLTIDVGDGNGSFTLLGLTNSQVSVGGTSLTATATNILFDFGPYWEYASFSSLPIDSRNTSWYLSGFTLPVIYGSIGDPYESVSHYFYGGNNYRIPTRIFRSGLVTIATLQEAGNVPEPTTIALVGLGLAGIRLASRKSANSRFFAKLQR